MANRFAWLALALGGCGFDASGVPGGDAGRGIDSGPPIDTDPDLPDGPPVDADPVVSLCPDGYVASEEPALTHRYRFVTSQATWDEAVVDCANDGQPQTYLVVIDSAAEDDFVDRLSDNRDVWAGATDAAVEGVWLTVLGDPLPYEDFRGAQPDNGGDPLAVPGEDCLELLDGDLGWNDLACATNRRYVCECGTD